MLVTHHLWLAVYTDRGTGTRTRGAERPEVLVIKHSLTTMELCLLIRNLTPQCWQVRQWRWQDCFRITWETLVWKMPWRCTTKPCNVYCLLADSIPLCLKWNIFGSNLNICCSFVLTRPLSPGHSSPLPVVWGGSGQKIYRPGLCRYWQVWTQLPLCKVPIYCISLAYNQVLLWYLDTNYQDRNEPCVREKQL